MLWIFKSFFYSWFRFALLKIVFYIPLKDWIQVVLFRFNIWRVIYSHVIYSYVTYFPWYFSWKSLILYLVWYILDILSLWCSPSGWLLVQLGSSPHMLLLEPFILLLKSTNFIGAMINYRITMCTLCYKHAYLHKGAPQLYLLKYCFIGELIKF